MSEIRLSSKQQEIVEASDGAILVLASAGSGKTRVLTERIRHLLTSKKGTFKILALTFTNKAAEEMQVRLKGVKEAKDRTFIGTIHKFCLEIIRSKGAAIGLTEMPHIFEKESDRLEILIEVFNSNPIFKRYLDDLEEGSERSKYLARVLNFISQKKKDLLGSSQNPTSDEDDEDFQLFTEYNAVLSSQNAIDFDDVICLAYKIICERPKVAELYRRMYKYICVDEAQDLNFAQYEFIKALCGNENKNVLMVGDPNQAIYGFNGSDKTYMTEAFKNDFSAKEIRLTENYRSSKKVLIAANKLMPGSVDVSNAAVNGEFETRVCASEEDEANWIASKIGGLLNKKSHSDIEGEITANSIAVLARNRYVFSVLEKTLKKKKIPFYYKKTNDLSDFESDLVKAYDLGLRILVNPLDTLHFQQLCKLLRVQSHMTARGVAGFEKLIALKVKIKTKERLEDYNTLLDAWKLVDSGINNFLRAIDILARYVHSSENAEMKLLAVSDFDELREYWRQYSLSARPDEKSLSSFRNQIALGIPSSVSKKNQGVTLGTIHSVKGLEFDVVFVMGLSDGTFPDYRAVREGAKAINEEKNNAFVALTRSKRLLYLTFPKNKFMPWDKQEPVEQKPSRFIKPFLV